MLVFFIQHLTTMTILAQGWKVDWLRTNFDIIERLGTNLIQKSKVEDQSGIYTKN